MTSSDAAIDPQSRDDRVTVTRLYHGVLNNWIFGVLILLIAYFSIRDPVFLSRSNWLNLSNTAVVVTLLAVAQTYLIIAGVIDLSQGAVLALSGCAGAWVVSHWLGGADAHHPTLVILAGFLICLGVGVVVGLFNGLLVCVGNVNPFVVTLGTLGIATGLVYVLTNVQDITDMPPGVGEVGSTNVFGWFPIPVIVGAILCLAAGIVLAKTRYGLYTYVIGDSRATAERAALKINRHIVSLYVLSGLAAAMASALNIARLADASPATGTTDLLNAISAAVIGGASLAGGRGSVGRTVIGAAIITVLLIGLVITNVQGYWQLVAVGVVLIVAVYSDDRGRRRHTAQIERGPT